MSNDEAVDEAIRALQKRLDGSLAPGKLYPAIDSVALGDFYLWHVEAMTAEGLHDKGAIAAQLAWRDAKIAELREALVDAVAVIEEANEIMMDELHEPFDEMVHTGHFRELAGMPPIRQPGDDDEDESPEDEDDEGADTGAA